MSLFNNAKLILTPNGYKDGKLYTLKPFDVSNDFDVVRATKATRVNSNGLIEEVDNNIIRLDYTENSCPCILVEEQRTNLLLHSEDFDNAFWMKAAGSSVESDVAISPSGDMSADVGIGPGQLRFSSPQIFPDNADVTLSVFAKKNAGDFFSLRIRTKFGLSIDRLFNLSDGTTSGSGLGFIEPLINEWFRCALTANVGEGGNTDPNRIILPASDILIWGAQLEQGTEPSSYIPTTTSTVTRNADIVTVLPPAGTTQIIETFEDNSTNIITSIPSTYQLPVGRIKHIVML